MGRRPNVIVAEFFERGAKLEDSSNRYQHTCRRCGELFPKGRVDNLITHLLKRCPNVTQDNRNYIILHMQQTPTKKDDSIAKPQPPDPVNHNLGLSVSLERQQSALDTLAEVSRRHLDYSSQRDATYDHSQQLLQDADQALAEQALWAQLQQHNINMSGSQPTEVYELQIPREYDDSQPFTSTDFAAPLLQTTGGAHLPHNDMTSLNALDPQLGSGSGQTYDLSSSALNQLLSSNTHQQNLAVQPTDHNSDLQWAPQLTSTVPTDPFDAAQSKSVRVKQRGRFTDARRKEVQEIRKRGACIRCRMLKKPCSEGTPCNTCANVDTARLWKGKCLRTRLADEFTAWSSGYFQALAALETQGITSGEYARRSPNGIHVKLDIDAEHGVMLTGKIYTKPASELAATLQIASRYKTMYGETSCILESSDDLPDRISAYFMSESVLHNAIDSEPHAFLQTTLKQALELLSHEHLQLQHEQMRSENTRACYSIANSLTQDTLELWLLTGCLTAGQMGSSSPTFLINTASNDPLSKSDVDIIQSQLLAAVELRAARLSKKVLNDLERRLLQRQQVSGFETFIAAVILISSVERMTGFYQSLDTLNITTTRSEWPIETAPRSIWAQGSSFATLLTMLLRMRGLPPRTYANEHGILAVVYESSDKLMKLNGSASELQLRALDEERRTALSAWLKNCNLTADEVHKWMESSSPDYYGKFIAALLTQ